MAAAFAIVGCGGDDAAGNRGMEGDASSEGDAEARGDARSAADGSASAPLDARVGDPPSGERADSAAPAAPRGDGGDELAQALERAGVRADRRRFELVFEASCRHDVACGVFDDFNRCIDENLESSGFVLVSAEACIDATLDQMACHAQLGCTDGPELCIDGIAAAFKACAADFGDAGAAQ